MAIKMLARAKCLDKIVPILKPLLLLSINFGSQFKVLLDSLKDHLHSYEPAPDLRLAPEALLSVSPMRAVRLVSIIDKPFALVLPHLHKIPLPRD